MQSSINPPITLYLRVPIPHSISPDLYLPPPHIPGSIPMPVISSPPSPPRLHQLVSRYHDVDPGEHRLLEGKYQEAEKSLVASQTALQTLQATVSDTRSCLYRHIRNVYFIDGEELLQIALDDRICVIVLFI